MTTENALQVILIEKIKQNSLVLPTLPAVALKVSEAADDPDIHLGKMSDIISQDAALSLGIVKIANSALLGRLVKVETVSQAVTRIGLRQIKTISTAMAMQQVYASENEVIAMYMHKYWMKTVDVASVAISLMELYLQKNKHCSLSLEVITLASLVYNIGVLPILTESEHHVDVFANPTFLKQAINNLAANIGGTVTRAWGLSDEFSLLTEQWSDLSILPEEVHYLDFIRAGAAQHGLFKNPATKASLITIYTQKEILPDESFLDSEDFIAKCSQVKAIFIS